MKYNDEKLLALGYVRVESESVYWPIVYERNGKCAFYVIMISKDLGVVARQGEDEYHLTTAPLTREELKAVAELVDSMEAMGGNDHEK